MSLSDKTSGISELNSLPTLFLLEGPKFPFDFKISPSNQSKSFKIKNQTIYLYPDNNDNNELFMNDDDHAVKTANNVWDAVRFFFFTVFFVQSYLFILFILEFDSLKIS